jgi:ketosteroid isomerase-like protein
MSQQNVEIVRRLHDAYARGDLEAVLAALDPEIEVHDHDLPDSASYRGLEGVRQWQADWGSSWEDWGWDAEEFIEAGERVVAVLRVHAKGRRSGIDVEQLNAAVWTLRDGKCVRLDYYDSRDQALQAAGLRD